jgi:hypothetical protein
MTGWPSPPTTEERPFTEKYRDLPALGRLTGRSGTANLEVVLKAKPDLILDFGSANQDSLHGKPLAPLLETHDVAEQSQRCWRCFEATIDKNAPSISAKVASTYVLLAATPLNKQWLLARGRG